MDLDTLRGFFAASPFMVDLGRVMTQMTLHTRFTEAEVYAINGAERTLVMKASGTMAVTPMNR